MSNETEYVLGTDQAELARLELQHRLWSAQAFALWERAGFAPGQTILDVGCGPGFATWDLSQLAGPTGNIIAVDESERFIHFLKSDIATRSQTTANRTAPILARVGDVQRLDLTEGTVDSAYARWVLCFVRDPEAVVAGVAKALKPGGVFAVQDYFNYTALTLAPRSEAIDRIIRAVHQSWRDHGGDDDVVARLPAIMSRCGLKVREIKPILRVATPDSPLWQWPNSFFRNYVPRLVEMGFVTRDEQRAFQEDWAIRSRDPHTFFMTPPVFDVIAQKP